MLAPVITPGDLLMESPLSITERLTALRAAGAADRQVLTTLAKAAMAAAEDAAWRLRTYLADGWNGDPIHTPTTGLSPAQRDLQLLAALVAAYNAATLSTAVRARQHIDRPTGWDPLHLR